MPCLNDFYKIILMLQYHIGKSFAVGTAALCAAALCSPLSWAQADDAAPAKSAAVSLPGKPATAEELAELNSEPYSRAVDVFVAGQGNPYTSIRIPDIINANGKLVAMAEGRYQDTDQGQNDLIVSVSKDGGKTWSKPTVAASSKGATFNNPCLIYDRDKKQIVLFFQRYPEGVKERTRNIPTGWQDKRCIRNFVCTS